MSWFENLVARLGTHVNKQLDTYTDQQDFIRASDAQAAGDYQAALAGFEALAERNHGHAAALAGAYYVSGAHVKENGTKALKYLEIGAKAGDKDAIALLGMTYAAGKAGVKIDYVKARPLLEEAVRNGDLAAQKMLAIVKTKQKGKR